MSLAKLALELVGLGLFGTSVATLTVALALLGKVKLDAAAAVSTFTGVLNAFLGLVVLFVAEAVPAALAPPVATLLLVLAFTFWGAGIIIGKGLDLKALGSVTLVLGIFLLVLAVPFSGVGAYFAILLVLLAITYFALTGFTFGAAPGALAAALLVIDTLLLLYGGAGIFLGLPLP